MTVLSTTRKQTFSCDGVADDFAITYPFIETTDLKVTHVAADGTQTVLTEGSDYSVSSPSMTFETGGTVHTNTVYASGVSLVVERVVPLTQELNLIEGDELPAESLEQELDKLTMAVQQIDQDKIEGPAVSVDERIALFDGTTGAVIKQSAYGESDLDNFEAHRTSDGKDHSDVVLNNAHRVQTTTPHVTSGEKATWNAKWDNEQVAGMDDTPFLANDDVFATVKDPALVKSPYKTPWSLVKSTLKTYFDTLYNVAASIHSATAKTTPVDADELGIVDTEASNVLKKLTLTNMKAFLKTYFDGLYNLYVHPNHSGEVTSAGDGAQTITNKAVVFAKMQDIAYGFIGKSNPLGGAGVPVEITPATAGTMIVGAGSSDAAPSNASTFPYIKDNNPLPSVYSKMTWANIKSSLKTYFDTLYEVAGSLSGHLLAFAHGDIAINSAARHARSHALNSGDDHSGTLALTQLSVPAQGTVLGNSPYIAAPGERADLTMQLVGQGMIDFATLKTDMSDDCSFGYVRSIAPDPDGFCRIKWSSIKAAMKSYFDGIYATIASLLGYHKHHGFEDVTATLSMVGSNFTVTPSGAYDIFVNGVKGTISVAKDVAITTDKTLHYVTMAIDGTLSVSTSAWDISDYTSIPVATVFKDGTNYIIGDERHNYDRNLRWHEWAHLTIGTRYYSGLTGTFDNTTLSVTQGVIYDEDIQFDTGGTKTDCALWYRDTGATQMRVVPATSTPYAVTGGEIAYDNAGTLTKVPQTGGGRYVTNFVYATNDAAYPIHVVVGQEVTTSLAAAQAVANPSILLSTAEWKMIYKVIYRNVGGTATFIQAIDTRSVSEGPANVASATSHAALTGRDAANSHPADAISYDGTTSGLAADDVQAAIDEVVAEMPSPYTLPVADAGTLGGVKVGTNLSIDGGGVLSASGGVEQKTSDYTTAIANIGKIWMRTDNTSALMKTVAKWSPGEGVWATSGGALPAAAVNHGCVGSSQTSAVLFGGIASDYTTKKVDAYLYDGATWATTGSLSTARSRTGGAGTSSAGLAISGDGASSVLDSCEEFNGATWAAGGTYSSVLYSVGGCGTQSAALGACGISDAPYVRTVACSEYDGAAWSAGGNASEAKHGVNSFGTQTAGAIVGGNLSGSSDNSSRTEEYDGAAWSTVNSAGNARQSSGSFGTQTAGAYCGGYGSSYANQQTQTYDGTNWSNSGNLVAGRTGNQGGAGGTTAAITSGGTANGTDVLLSTENFGGFVTGLKTIGLS